MNDQAVENRDRAIYISVVIPLFDERENLRELYQRLVATLQGIGRSYEIIFVDDGSEDGSYEVLEAIFNSDPDRVKVIKFRRNYGKSSALSAGFKATRGEIIVTMDADLQDQPEEIPKLLRKMAEDYDLVSGWRHRRADGILKRVLSRIYNVTTAKTTGIRVHDFNCCLKAYRRVIFDSVTVFGEMHRYIPVMASWRGFRIGEIKVDHKPRRHGHSKYKLSQYPGGFFDLLTVILLTRFSRKPLHLFGLLGTLLVAIGFLINVYLTIGWLLERWIQNRPIFMLGILMMIIGVQFIFFGLMAEMIAYSSKREEEILIDKYLGENQRASVEPAVAD